MLPIHSPLDREIIVPEPIDKYPGYYYFPDYRHIGVSKDGKVIDIKSGKEIKVSFI